MEKEAWNRGAPEPRHLQRIRHQATLHLKVHAPAHNLSAEQIIHRCQVSSTFLGGKFRQASVNLL